MDLHRRYNSLHKRYLDLKGDEFDLYDIENASISYAYNTCGIEGNTISLGETESFLKSDIVIANKSFKEHGEIKDAQNAFRQVYKRATSGYTLNEDMAMTIHKEVTKSTLDEKYQGTYKTITNRVGGRSTPYPAKVKAMFPEALQRFQESKDPVILKAARLHLDMVIIHPWQDGNGRASRLMMNFVLLSNNHSQLQIRKTDRERYFKAIRDSIDKKDYKIFDNYIVQEATKSLEKKVTFLEESNNRDNNSERGIWDVSEPAEFYI
jgi:Fic family protein